MTSNIAVARDGSFRRNGSVCINSLSFWENNNGLLSCLFCVTWCIIGSVRVESSKVTSQVAICYSMKVTEDGSERSRPNHVKLPRWCFSSTVSRHNNFHTIEGRWKADAGHQPKRMRVRAGRKAVVIYHTNCPDIKKSYSASNCQLLSPCSDLGKPFMNRTHTLRKHHSGNFAHSKLHLKTNNIYAVTPITLLWLLENSTPDPNGTSSLLEQVVVQKRPTIWRSQYADCVKCQFLNGSCYQKLNHQIFSASDRKIQNSCFHDCFTGGIILFGYTISGRVAGGNPCLMTPM